MTDAENPNETDNLSVNDMRHVFQNEVRDIMRAASLRIHEFSEIVNDYAADKLTPEEAMKRYDRYADKWGEDILPGYTKSTHNVSDEEIRAVMDKAADSDRQHQEMFARRAGSSTRRR